VDENWQDGLVTTGSAPVGSLEGPMLTAQLDAQARQAIRMRQRLRRAFLAVGVLFLGPPALFAVINGPSTRAWLAVGFSLTLLLGVWLGIGHGARHPVRQLHNGAAVHRSRRMPISQLLITGGGLIFVLAQTARLGGVGPSSSVSAHLASAGAVVLTILLVPMAALGLFAVALSAAQLLSPAVLILNSSGVVVTRPFRRPWSASFDQLAVQARHQGGFTLGASLTIGLTSQSTAPRYLATAGLDATAWELMWILEHFIEHPEDRAILDMSEAAAFVESLRHYVELNVDSSKSTWFRPPPAAWAERNW
jgi:hypothetical protein